MKNKRGFTLIELLVSFALITIVSISLFRTVLAVQKKAQKDISYNQYIAFAATFNNAIELDFTNNTIISVAPCGQNCYDIIYSDSGTKRFSIDRNNNSVMYGTIKEKLPAYYEFAGDIKIELDTAYSAPSNAFNSVAKLIIPLKSSLLSFNQDLRYVYQYDNRVNDIAQTLYTTLTINPLGGKYDGSTENKVYNILPGQTINILDPTDKAGNVFDQWNFSGSGTFSNGVFTASTGDAVLTAGWLTYANMYTYVLQSTGVAGTSSVIDDGNGNWRIKFYGPGTYIFTPKVAMQIEAFLVGGGGGGGTGASQSNFGGSGGGGGYTTYNGVVTLAKNSANIIVIGAGGGSDANGTATTAFGYSAAGGIGGKNGISSPMGGVGGSGGGSFGGSQSAGANGGSDGRPGGANSPNPGAVGQFTTTREFGLASGTLYSGGGGSGAFDSGAGSGGAGGGGNGANRSTNGGAATANTGGGGGGAGALGASGGAGGAGIVVIRNSTTSYTVGNTTKYSFTYTGILSITDANTDTWKIKFLKNGTFTPASNMPINVFLVGGGGGGGYASGGNYAGAGGGSGYTTNATVSLTSGTAYNIVIGTGGSVGAAGVASTAFGYSASGGSGAGSGAGAAGGSGGGAVDFQAVGKNGGTNGGNGAANGAIAGGAGQGSTTRAFASGTEELYAGGGASGAFSGAAGTGGTGGGGNGGDRGYSGYTGTPNTGGGGGGAGVGGASGAPGGSGIVIIRKQV